MDRLDALKQNVRAMYDAEKPGCDEWVPWIREHHLPFVAKKAREIAGQVGANAELAEASAWLHDIGDTVTARFADNHEAEGLRIATEVMKDAGYSEEEIATVVGDALPLHSCHNGQRPQSLEGQVLATADALAHLTTDFYIYAAHVILRFNLEELKEWTLKKAARDFNDKICFDDIRESARPDYEVIKNLFSRAPV